MKALVGRIIAFKYKHVTKMKQIYSYLLRKEDSVFLLVIEILMCLKNLFQG